jgi:hypothetical protein
MKKIIGLSFIVVLLTLQSCGTTSNMQEFYSKYDNQSTVIPLPSFALKLAGKAGGTELFNYLKSAKVFVVTDAGDGKQKRIMNDLQSSMRGENYENLVKLKAKNNRLNVSLQEDGDRVKKMIFGINGLRNVLVIDSKLDIPRADLDKVLDKVSADDIADLADILK